MTPAKFDEYSTNYTELVDESVSISGEASEYFAEYKARYLARLAGKDFAGHILDYGCGVGVLSSFIKTHLPKASVDGFDVASGSIEKVLPELKQQGCFSSDLAGLRRDYQLAVIANVLHHVTPSDRQSVIAEIAGRLVSGGRVVVFEHNPLNPLTQWSVKHCPFDDDAILLHPAEPSRYLSRSGLKKVRRDYVVFFPKFLAWLRPTEPMLAWLPAGAQYALVGEKP